MVHKLQILHNLCVCVCLRPLTIWKPISGLEKLPFAAPTKAAL